MAYHQFIDHIDRQPFGSFEVFQDDGGWFWWACFPGCLPDGERSGPFETEQGAIDDALGL